MSYIEFSVLKKHAKRVFLNSLTDVEHGLRAAAGLDAILFVARHDPIIQAHHDALLRLLDAHHWSRPLSSYFSEQPRASAALEQFLSGVRDAGVAVIDRWEAHNVKKLVQAFPYCVPFEFRHASLCVARRGGDNDEWIVYAQPARILRGEPGLDVSAQFG
jgi:hypothetical protein